MGHDVVVLGRAAAREAGRVHHAQWDGKTLGEWHKFLDGATAVVNLTGKSVNCRYTPENKREIIDSRRRLGPRPRRGDREMHETAGGIYSSRFACDLWRPRRSLVRRKHFGR